MSWFLDSLTFRLFYVTSVTKKVIKVFLYKNVAAKNNETSLTFSFFDAWFGYMVKKALKPSKICFFMVTDVILLGK